MQRGNPCGLPPLVYGSGECLYFQAPLSPTLLSDTDLSAPPFALPALGAAAPWLTQGARVWVGVRGAVSPLHWDVSHSFLTQIRGRWERGAGQRSAAAGVGATDPWDPHECTAQ